MPEGNPKMRSKTRLMTRVIVHEMAARLGFKIKTSNTVDSKLQQFLSTDAVRRGLTSERVRSAIAAHSVWWHTIALPFGIMTPGRVRQDMHDWIAQAIPADLSGSTVLDVGAWDGYYSFLAETRGASVLAIDADINPQGTAGFDIIRRLLGSKAEYKIMDVENIETLGKTFDVVFFLGVYYHLKNPFLTLEKLARITNSLLILEGHFITRGRQPMMRFYPRDELGGDSSNWWAGNESSLISMLEVCGFKKVSCVAKLRDFKGGGRILITARK